MTARHRTAPDPKGRKGAKKAGVASTLAKPKAAADGGKSPRGDAAPASARKESKESKEEPSAEDAAGDSLEDGAEEPAPTKRTVVDEEKEAERSRVLELEAELWAQLALEALKLSDLSPSLAAAYQAIAPLPQSAFTATANAPSNVSASRSIAFLQRLITVANAFRAAVARAAATRRSDGTRALVESCHAYSVSFVVAF